MGNTLLTGPGRILCLFLTLWIFFYYHLHFWESRSVAGTGFCGGGFCFLYQAVLQHSLTQKNPCFLKKLREIKDKIFL